MSLAQQALSELDSTLEFFNRSTRNLTEAHSAYRPAPDTMTTAQEVAHVAQTIDWFIEGAFRPEGFNMDFDALTKVTNACTSLADARAWLERAMTAAKQRLATLSDADLLVPLPKEGIMGGAPRMAVISAITDHTAHHRGALTVYARLNAVVPPMPYMEM